MPCALRGNPSSPLICSCWQCKAHGILDFGGACTLGDRPLYLGPATSMAGVEDRAKAIIGGLETSLNLRSVAPLDPELAI